MSVNGLSECRTFALSEKISGERAKRAVPLLTFHFSMTYAELCKHMAEHNSVYGEDVCLGVANKLQSCLLEQLLEGKKVQFGDLGTFYLSVKGTGVDNEEDYNIGVCINGLFLRFAPNRQDVNDLSSKTLKKKATLVNVKDLIESKAKKPATTIRATVR